MWRGVGERTSLCRGLLPSALPGWAPRRAAPPAHSWVPPFRRGPRRLRRAAGRQRVMQECVGRRLGARGARLRSPLLPRPPLGAAALSGGRGAAAPPTSWGAGGGRGGEVWGGGGFPLSPPLVPWRRPPTAAGGWPGGSGPGGLAANWGGVPVPRPPPPSGHQAPVQVLARAPCPPRCRRVASAGRGGRGGGLLSAGGGGSGQRSAVSRLRGCGPPLALVAPILSPTGGCARPFAAPHDGGGCGSGGQAPLGGASRCPPPPSLRSMPASAGRGRHLHRRLCGGWGCGGGGFRRR